MSRIKYTIVPKENVETCIFESGVKLSESDTIINPMVIFNVNMELGIEQDIYGDNIDQDNVRFTQESNLLSVLSEANDEDFCNTVIINGFNIDLDYIRDNIAKLAQKSGKIYSINVISDKRKYTNFTLNLTSEISNELTDEEWELYKKDYEESFEESLAQDVEENKIRPRCTEEEAERAMAELLKAICGIDNSDMPDDDEGSLLAIIDNKDNAIVPSKKESDYQAYSFANNDGMVTIEAEYDQLVIMDEEHEVVFPRSYIDFIIDTLNKLK